MADKLQYSLNQDLIVMFKRNLLAYLKIALGHNSGRSMLVFVLQLEARKPSDGHFCCNNQLISLRNLFPVEGVFTPDYTYSILLQK